MEDDMVGKEARRTNVGAARSCPRPAPTSDGLWFQAAKVVARWRLPAGLDPDDCVQELCARWLAAPPSHIEPDSITAQRWLGGVLRNVVREWTRRRDHLLEEGGGGYVCRGEHRRLHRSACVGARRGGRRVGLPTATAGVASSAVPAAGGGYRSRAPLGWRVVPRCVCVAWRVLGARRLVAPTENLAILVQQGRPARISLVVARRGRSLGVAAEKNPTNQVEFP